MVAGLTLSASAASSSVASPRNYARLLCDQGDFTGARPLIERALAIREKALGPEHPDTATSLNNLAFLLREQGDLAGARPLYERALGQSGSRSSAPTIPSQRRASTTSRACFVTRATSLGRDRLFIARWRSGSRRRPEHFLTAASLNILCANAAQGHVRYRQQTAAACYLEVRAICAVFLTI